MHLGRTEPILGKKIAVLGLGRSGLAVAQAAMELGADAAVFDEKAEEAIAKQDVLRDAQALGVRLALGYVPNSRWFHLEGWIPEWLVVNPAVPRDHVGIQSALAERIEVISEVEFASRITRAPMVAITGTNGKSTTTVMTYLCLKSCGVDAVLCGNIYGSGYPEVSLTEAALRSNPDQILVAEISSFQLEWVTSDFAAVAAAITNISPDHLDRYEDFDDYAETKWNIFGGERPGYVAVLPKELVGSGPIMEREGYVFGALGKDEPAPNGAEFDDETLWIFRRPFPIAELPFSSNHNLLNAAAAVLLAAGALFATGRGHLPVAPDCIFAGLKAFDGLAHRMEALGTRDGVSVINNSMCTNPAAVVSSTRSIGKLTHILIGGINKGLEFEPLRVYLAESGNKAYLFGTDAPDLAKMLGENLPTFSTMQSAFEAAVKEAKLGETIMLAPGCASTDQFRDFRHRGDVFKAIAMEWLNRDQSLEAT